jgi:zinc transport system substrate-binding protein
MMLSRRATIGALAALASASGLILPARAEPHKLRVGITLHPYYSWVANICDDRVEIIPMIKAGFEVHNYEPQPDDIKRAATMDVLVMNGIGHDAFALKVLEAAEVRDKVKLIYANEGVALIPASGDTGEEKVYNPHTFIAITAAIQQIFNIANDLGKIDPDNAEFYRKNARAYAVKLRKLKAKYINRLAGVDGKYLRVATIHGGYDYLMQEFGLDVVAVVEPAHGLMPSASQLKDTIDKIKSLHVGVVFSQMMFPDQFVETIKRETGASIYTLVHITEGDYTKEKFEEGIDYDMKTITDAVLAAQAAGTKVTQ